MYFCLLRFFPEYFFFCSCLKIHWRCNKAFFVYQVRVKNSDNDASVNDIASLIKTRYREQSGTEKRTNICSFQSSEQFGSLFSLPQGSCMCFPRRMLSRCHLSSRNETSWLTLTTPTWTLQTSPASTADGPPTRSRCLKTPEEICLYKGCFPGSLGPRWSLAPSLALTCRGQVEI